MSDYRDIAFLGFRAIVTALFPSGGSLLADAIKTFADYSVERARKTLMEEIRAGDIEKLSEAQKRDLVPIGYRYYEAARSGCARRNLKILAQIISGMINSEKLDPQVFSLISSRIEYLSINELIVLSCYIDYIKNKDEIGAEKKDEYIKNLSLERGIYPNNEYSIRSSLSVLASYGWVVMDNNLFDIGGSYSPTNLVLELVNLDINSILKEVMA